MANPDKEAENLGYYMHRAFAALADELSSQLREEGLAIGHSHFAIIRGIGRAPGISQNRLARILGRDIAAISRSIAFLERKGFIRRAWVNGRSKGVYLTQSGESLMPCLERAIQRTIEKACQNSTADEIERCICALKNILFSLKGDK